MAILNSMRILEENNTSDATSITSLSFTHRALSDVSCLSEFKNLEKLDLSFNNLISLESLMSCVNLKWLSVANNNLQSLKGIECLSKLIVFNAGKNKLKSMNELETLTSLRALILNDNEINSVCSLHHMTELNTLVLSRNPISSLPESLNKLKSITKLSLSKCNLYAIDLSLTSCLNLKELRFAHNEIMSIPDDFKYLVKLQNLDMGNNLISNWTSIKALSSLVKLRNLNLQGNPIAEKVDLLKKVKKFLPRLHIFNGRPIDKISGKDRVEKAEVLIDEGDIGHLKKVKESDLNENTYKRLGNAGKIDKGKKTKELVQTKDEKTIESSKNTKKLKVQHNDVKENKHSIGLTVNSGEAREENLRKTGNQTAKKSVFQLNVDEAVKEGDKKSRECLKMENGSMIDSAEISFTDIFSSVPLQVSVETGNRSLISRTNPEIGRSRVIPSKKKKRNQGVKPDIIEFSHAEEIGLGGASAWE